MPSLTPFGPFAPSWLRRAAIAAALIALIGALVVAWGPDLFASLIRFGDLGPYGLWPA